HLKLARLPIPPPSHTIDTMKVSLPRRRILVVFGDTSIVNYAGCIDCCKNGRICPQEAPAAPGAGRRREKDDYFFA
ncbi:hypothetical protein MWG98_25660, partial [Klebsiella quasipneumoniae]|uniref:hypothetical protein n=1 Tax=Klebsiella quasipneumoniae TaxID=1463165 RepID=UPI001FF6BEFB